MHKEYSTSHQMGNYPDIIIFAILSFFPFLGIFLSFSAVYVSYLTYVEDGYVLSYSIIVFMCIMPTSLVAYWIGWVFISRGLAKYKFTDAGLVAKFPLRKEELILWDEFQQVCVCYAAYTTRGERRANTALFCIKKGEVRNGHGRWKTDNPFRYRTVICIDYSESLYNGLADKYPGNVADLRDTPEYRL